MQLETLNDVEIFAAGTWNGDTYTEQDLDEIVRAYGETREYLKPYVKLGHKQNDLLRNDGLPAAGWITALRRVGDRLLATFSNVPGKIAELIRRRAYGRVSSEIYVNPVIEKKQYRYALKAVALLGGETPAVGSLNDFIDLYGLSIESRAVGFDSETPTVTINYSRREKQMNEVTIEQREYSELQRKAVTVDTVTAENEALKTQVKEFSQQVAEKETELTQLREFKKNAEAEGVKRFSAEVTAFFEQAVKDEKITPAQKEKYFSKAAESAESFEFVKGLIEDLPAKSQEYSKSGTQATTHEHSMNGTPTANGEELDAKASAIQKQYASEGKTISYERALVEAEQQLKGKEA